MDHDQILERLRSGDLDGLTEKQVGLLKQFSGILSSLQVEPLDLSRRSVTLMNHENVILGEYLSHLIMAFESSDDATGLGERKPSRIDLIQDASMMMEGFFERELHAKPEVARKLPGIVETLVSE